MHMVSAFAARQRLSQVSVDEKSNKINATPKLLALKGNQGALHSDVALFVAEQMARGFHDSKISRNTTVDGDHRPRAATVIHEVTWLQKRHQWPGLKALLIIDRTRETAGRIEQETRLYLTSLMLTVGQLGAFVRSH
jgi:hypothetical protein